jgi:hypothetical protein
MEGARAYGVHRALKLQFGNLPDYDWMVRCQRDEIAEKIVNLTRAANPKWFITDSLYACQGNGPLASVTFGGPDLNTAYIGSLKGKRIPYFRSPVPGLPMVHWKR